MPRYDKKRRRLASARADAHEAFDRLWRDSRDPKRTRRICYRWLAAQLHIPQKWCHFSRLRGKKLQAAIHLVQHATIFEILTWMHRHGHDAVFDRRNTRRPASRPVERSA